MRVFISWSGNRSKAVAELLNEWIQCVLQAYKPWMSTEMDRGTFWFNEINDQLKETSIGVICLTRENLDNPWILFEAGSLAKGLNSSRVIPLLVDLEVEDLDPPLSMFNNNKPDEEGMRSLVGTLNKALDEAEKSLDPDTLRRVFDTYWPQFEKGFQAALKANPPGKHSPSRSTGDILNEVLGSVRGLDHRMRALEGSTVRLGGAMGGLFGAAPLGSAPGGLLGSGDFKEESAASALGAGISKPGVLSLKSDE